MIRPVWHLEQVVQYEDGRRLAYVDNVHLKRWTPVAPQVDDKRWRMTSVRFRLPWWQAPRDWWLRLRLRLAVRRLFPASHAPEAWTSMEQYCSRSVYSGGKAASLMAVAGQ